MTYGTFLNNAIITFSSFLSYITTIYNILIGNFIFKTIIYLAITIFAIDFLFKIIDLLKKIFSKKEVKKKELV